MTKTIFTLVLAVALVTTGCANRAATANVPGSANQFDSDTYLTLVSAKAVIDQTKADLASNSFPASIVANVKKAVNDAVSAYNVLDVTYQAYHTSALAGGASAAQQNAVQTASANLQTAITNVTAAKGAN